MTEHAYRGRGLEDLLDLAHALYLGRGTAMVRHYHLAARFRGGRQGSHLAALDKSQQPPDYHAALAPEGRLVVFDAKETKDGAAWSLDDRYRHQYERLKDWSGFGALAFFAVLCLPRDRLFILRVLPSSPWPRLDFEVPGEPAGVTVVAPTDEGWFDWLRAVRERGWID